MTHQQSVKYLLNFIEKYQDIDIQTNTNVYKIKYFDYKKTNKSKVKGETNYSFYSPRIIVNQACFFTLLTNNKYPRLFFYLHILNICKVKLNINLI